MVKAPRFAERPMPVAPLAQVLVGYASGHAATKRWADHALATASRLSGTPLSPAVLHSTLGRHLARAVRCAALAELTLERWDLLAANVAGGDTAVFNAPNFPRCGQRGFGFHEAPRGTLSHRVVMKNGRILDYQAVVPSTWNAGPRDAKGQRGPYEAALLGTPVADPGRPLEVLRTVHSLRSVPRVRGPPRGHGTAGDLARPGALAAGATGCP